MAWTANVLKKDVVSGVLLVTVRYTEGERTLDETYRNHGYPAEDWIEKTAKSKIIQLEGADIGVSAIASGAVAEPKTELVDPNIALFRSRCRVLETVKVMIDLGAIESTNTKVVELVKWIKDNAGAYFDKLEK